MIAHNERSEAVIEAYRKHKLAGSALRRIHEIIYGFEQDRAFDLQLARIGVVVIIVILGVAAYYFFGSDSLTLS